MRGLAGGLKARSRQGGHKARLRAVEGAVGKGSEGKGRGAKGVFCGREAVRTVNAARDTAAFGGTDGRQAREGLRKDEKEENGPALPTIPKGR